tara:strand:- start:1643 stop:2260 length:618 start_codon:yes stop_codon:yes gene_type:complete
MNILELFAGSRSFSNIAENLGHKTFTSDINDFDKIDYVTNILDFDVNRVPFSPDIIWASCPCTFFSVASIGKHWHKDHTPKTEQAKLGIKIVQKTLDIIDHFKPKYFYIENPRGKLRKLDVISSVPYRKTITYCSYKDTRMKPTDIFTNDFNWVPRNMCHNGNRDCHHEPAPRGSKTGTQGLKGNYERSKIPNELCLEILSNKRV